MLFACFSLQETLKRRVHRQINDDVIVRQLDVATRKALVRASKQQSDNEQNPKHGPQIIEAP